jgi:uncharacterized repeat protein (TIGR03837 family)
MASGNVRAIATSAAFATDTAPMRWDLFCAVVDNLGDIGVCWRLARQLAAEHRAQVRLWVDDLVTVRRLLPAIDPELEAQRLAGVEVRRWTPLFPAVEPARIVVETFACELPASYVAAMKASPRPPVWINLEYLSAESWVGRCHALPSPQPPLTKYFFFPGFAADTGGVLMERGLGRARDAFQADAGAQAAFLSGLGVPARRPQERLVSLFCYPQAPARALFEAWEAGPGPVRVLAFAETAAAHAVEVAGLGRGQSRGNLTAQVLPFLSQDDYDRVLWACDWNFVRGEDSFVRAQWARRPFVWQAYPQRDDAHRLKVQSFLARYLGASALGPAAGLVDAWSAWNGLLPAARLGPAWQACTGAEAGLHAIAAQWTRQLEGLGDLAGNLARFCLEKV